MFLPCSIYGFTSCADHKNMLSIDVAPLLVINQPKYTILVCFYIHNSYSVYNSEFEDTVKNTSCWCDTLKICTMVGIF